MLHNVRLILPGSGPGSTIMWRRYVGRDPVDLTAPGELLPQGGNKADRGAAP